MRFVNCVVLTRFISVVSSLSTIKRSSLHLLPRPLHVVIVGGGVGGLAIASRIASAVTTANHGDAPSVQVTLMERNAQLGGRCGSYTVVLKDPNNPSRDFVFRHERGPSLLLLPISYQELFKEVSEGKLSSKDFGLEWVPCIPAYKAVFDDGDSVEIGFPAPGKIFPLDRKDDLVAREQRTRDKMNSWEPRGFDKWKDYLETSRAFLDCGLPNFIEEKLQLRPFPAFIHAALLKAWPLAPHSTMLVSFFACPKLQALASFQDLYVGLNPYEQRQELAGGVWQKTAPAVFSLLAALELHPHVGGVFAPLGGFGAVSASLERLAQSMNVSLRCNTTVTAITSEGVLYHDNNQAGVTQFAQADVIVVNADLPFAVKSLMDLSHAGEKTASSSNQLGALEEQYDWKDEGFHFSSGVLAFHWCLNRSLGDSLLAHNVFLSAQNRSDVERSWTVLRDDPKKLTSARNSSEPFNFYVHRPSVFDQTAAPEGMDSLMVLVPSATLIRNESWARLDRHSTLAKYRESQFNSSHVIDPVREAVLRRLAVLPELTDLKHWILHETVDTPVDYADRYNVAAGTPFGLSHGLGQLSWFRPGPDYCADTHPQVLFCGASSRPGNGVPLVLTGAKLVAEKTLSKLREITKK